MSNGLPAFLIGLGVSLVCIAPILWRYRREIKQSWQDALGVEVWQSMPSLESDDRRSSPAAKGKRILTVLICGLASLGNAVLAFQGNHGTVLYVLGAILFAGAALLL